MDTPNPNLTKKFAKMYYLPELWKSIQHIPRNHYARTRAQEYVEKFDLDNVKFVQIENPKPYQSSISTTMTQVTYSIVGDIEEFKTSMTTYDEEERAIIEGIPWTNEELTDVQTIFETNEDDYPSFGTKVFLKYQKKIFDLLVSKEIMLKSGDTINIFSFVDHHSYQTEQYLMYDEVDEVGAFFKMESDNSEYPKIPKRFQIFSDRFHPSYFDKLPFYYNFDFHVDSDFLKGLNEEMFEDGTYQSGFLQNSNIIEFTSEGVPKMMYDWKIKYTKDSFIYKGKSFHILIPRAKLLKDLTKARILNQEYFTSGCLGKGVEYNLEKEYFLTDFKKKYLNSKKITSEMSNEDLVKLVNGDIIILS